MWPNSFEVDKKKNTSIMAKIRREKEKKEKLSTFKQNQNLSIV